MNTNNNNGEMNSQTSTGLGSQPSNQNSDKGEGTLTRNQVDQILRGQGKELEKLKAENAKFKAAEQKRITESEKKSQAKLAEQGEFKSLYEQEVHKNKQLSNQLEEMIDSRKQRLERVNESNIERMKALPKDLQSLIHPTLGIEEKAEQITSLESMLKNEKLRIHGGVGVSNQQETGPLSHEQKMEKWTQMGSRMFDKGVKK